MDLCTNTSDIKISLKGIYLFHKIERFCREFFKGHSFTKHKNTYLISFFTATLASLIALYIVSGSSVVIIKSNFIPASSRMFNLGYNLFKKIEIYKT